jgi:transcriptional regulator with XRE-family HTH domain
MREAAGISAGELGRILGVSRQLPLQFEKAEADDSITLRSLRTVANALNCDLVYALAPRAEANSQAMNFAPKRRVQRHTDASARSDDQLVRRIGATIQAEVQDLESETPHPYFCD